MLNKLDEERIKSLNELEQLLGYKFKKIVVLNTATIHTSYVNESRLSNVEDNERMEFLGDAVLKLVISEYLYGNYAEKTEGVLTKIRSVVISDKVLAIEARSIGLSKFLLLGKNEQKNDGANRDKILGDTLEAIFGAVYFDGGIKSARKIILNILKAKILELADEKIISDYKSYLQEYSQKEGLELPVYELLEEIGPDHDKLFKIRGELNLGGKEVVSIGEAKTKKDAQQIAAKLLLKNIGLL
jgi:ribonuclease III